MASTYNQHFLYYDDIHYTEKEKSTFDYLQKKIDYNIYHLVHEKTRIQKCRNLYHGIRDAEEYKYLEDVYGIEQPIALKMTPLIKTRIDALIGIFLSENKKYLVSVNDSGTNDKVTNQKKNIMVKSIISKYNEAFYNDIQTVNKGQSTEEEPKNPVDEEFLKKMEFSLNDDFISEFEIAAQSLIKYFQQSNKFDLEQKLKLLFLDFLITGECYFRVHNSYLGADPSLDVYRPENMFFNKNTDSQYLTTDSVVARKKMKRTEILSKYGHLMDTAIREELFGVRAGLSSGHKINRGREIERVRRSYSNNHGTEYNYDEHDVIDVYEVEWIANTEVPLSEEEREYFRQTDDITVKQDPNSPLNHVSREVQATGFRQDRYYGVRIGEYIYLDCGKAKHQVRSQEEPFKTSLTFNGVAYNEKATGEPYSMAFSLKEVQDMHDIAIFHRDNLLAHSGIDGSRVNLASIPKVLGSTFMERLQKFIAYKKQGIELIDITEDGAQAFNHYGDYKNSVDGNVINSIQVVLESIERQADIISGVNRFMYQASEERDAVSNVKTGIQQTSLITKDLFRLMDVNVVHILEDLVNCAKVTYKYGKKGSYIVNGKTYLFNLMPEQFAFTDHNIHIVDSQLELIKLEKINMQVTELIKAGLIEPQLAIVISMSDSTTEILREVKKSIAKVQEDNSQLQQLAGQAEQMDAALKESESALAKYESQIKSLESKGSQLEFDKFEFEKFKFTKEQETTSRELKTSEDLAKSEIIKDAAVIKLEREQIYAENSKAMEVKNDL